MHVHDEIIAEVPNEFGSEEEFLHIMTELPDWADGLPLAAKAWSGQRFYKSESHKAEVKEAPTNSTTEKPAEEIAPPWEAAANVPFDDPIPRFSGDVIHRQELLGDEAPVYKAPPIAPELGSWAEKMASLTMTATPVANASGATILPNIFIGTGTIVRI
jgi:hypothetical protein